MNLLGTLLMMYKVLVRQDTYPAFLPCRVSSLACSLCQHAKDKGPSLHMSWVNLEGLSNFLAQENILWSLAKDSDREDSARQTAAV